MVILPVVEMQSVAVLASSSVLTLTLLCSRSSFTGTSWNPSSRRSTPTFCPRISVGSCPRTMGRRRLRSCSVRGSSPRTRLSNPDAPQRQKDKSSAKRERVNNRVAVLDFCKRQSRNTVISRSGLKPCTRKKLNQRKLKPRRQISGSFYL